MLFLYQTEKFFQYVALAERFWIKQSDILGGFMCFIFKLRFRVAVACALVLLFLCVSQSQAIDFKISGQWQVAFEYSDVAPRHAQNSHNDYFGAMQRFRVQLDAVASESLSGTVQLQLGRTEWGQAANGGALGADGKDVRVRLAYLDWVIPQTEIKVRMGLQMIMLPGVISQWGLGPVYGKQQAGITVSSPIYRGDKFNIDATAFWARPYNDNTTDPQRRYLDNMDNFALIVPITGQGFSFKPWVMYSLMGKYSMTDIYPPYGDNGVVAPRGGLMPVLGDSHTYTWFQNNYVRGLDRAWGNGIWAGLVGQIDLTDELRLGFEGAYGSVDMGSVKNYKGFSKDAKGRTFDVKREGWYGAARFDYKLDWGVPGILAWYGQGDDDNPYNGSERLPQYNTPWGVTSLGYGGGVFDELTWKVLGHNPGGSIGIVAQLDKMSFIEKLDHTLRFGYYFGTNSPKMPRKANMTWPTRADGPNAYLTTTDSAWELNLVTNYKMYENFTVSLDAAYLRLNLDSDTWRGAENGIWKDNYRIGTVFTYSF